jgi:ubiquinol-cytochrome c reductase cytochrome b subunit
MLHLVALHQHGSNNPLGIERKGPQDSIPFHPYYAIKDMLGLAVFLMIFAFFVFFVPDYLNDVDANIPDNPMQTPSEIVPRWYLLPFYAILRSIPNKLAGVIAMFSAVGILFIVPWLDTSKIRSARFRPLYKWAFWLLVVDVIVLGWVGAHRPEGIYVVVGRAATLYYFLHFLIALPLLGIIERPLPLPASITTAVLLQDRARPAAASARPERP